MMLFQVNLRLGKSIDNTFGPRLYYIIAKNAQEAMGQLDDFMHANVSKRWETDIERLDLLRLHSVIGDDA